jgi:hypothetical protein
LGGVLLAVADGGSAHFSIRGRTCLLDLVKPDRRVRGLAGTLLADCYLVEDMADAAEAQAKHPHAQFVTRDGVVVGATFVRTPARHEARVEKLLRQSASLERELGDVRRRLREHRQDLVQVNGRLDMARRRLQRARDGITAAAEEAAGVGPRSRPRQEKELVGERLRTLLSTASLTAPAVASRKAPRRRPAATTRAAHPPAGRDGIAAPRASRLEERCRLRRESSAAGGGPAGAAGRAGNTRGRAHVARAAGHRRLGAAEWAERHHAAVNAARESRDRHAETNRAWREQAAEAERIACHTRTRERGRLELERRIVEPERLLRESRKTEPEEAVRALEDIPSVAAASRRPGRAPARDGRRVNLLAATSSAPPRAVPVHDARLDDVRPRGATSARSSARSTAR